MRAFMHEDFEQITSWRVSRDAEAIDRDLFPPIGFIEPGIAAGFINFTQTKVAFIENIVSNPYADQGIREKAILQILETLENLAYDRGNKWIVAVTNHPRIEHYAYQIKGERIPGKLFGKRLGNGSR
jgi:hypothetical protein